MTQPARSVSSTAVDDGHQLARGAATNALVLVAANFRGVFTFLIARILGQAALGAFGLISTITDLLSKVATLGLEEGLVPLVARRRAVGDGEGARHLYRNGLAVTLPLATTLALSGLAAVTWLVRTHRADALTGGAPLMLLALPGITLLRLSSATSRGMLAMGNEFYARGVTETFVTIAAFVLAVAVGIHGSAPSLAVVIGSTAGGVMFCALTLRVLGRADGTHSVGRIGPAAAVRFALPIAGSGLANVLLLNLDVLLLGAWVGRAPGVTAASFGIFCAAAELAGGMRKVRQIFDPIFAPVAAARDVSSDPLALRETVQGPGRWVLAAQLPIVGLLALAGGTVLSIYGSAFRAGALWLALLAVAHCTNSFAGLVETLMMVKRPALNLLNAVVTVIVQVAASLVLIPRIGVTGAALAMCIGFAVQGTMRFVEMRQVFGWSWPWHSLRRPVAAFILAMIPAVAVRLIGGIVAEVASAVLMLALYAGAWMWLGAEPADREIWRRLRGEGRLARESAPAENGVQA